MTIYRKVCLAILLSGTILLPGASAQEKSAKEKIAATVNGHAITSIEIALAADDILPQLRDIPKHLRYPFIVEYLIERHLLAQDAERGGIAATAEFKERLAFYRSKALRDAYFTEVLKPSITPEKIKQVYKEQSAKVKGVERLRARHILVKTEKEAKAILAQLQNGGKFEELAKKHSTDGSRNYGGDLGYFTAEEMVPEFSQAAFALQKGGVSQPVQTSDGWHIIKVEDRKAGGPQPFEKVEKPIKLILLRQAVQNKVLELREKGKVVIVDPDLIKLQEQAKQQRQKLIEQRKEKKQQQGSGGKSDKAE